MSISFIFDFKNIVFKNPHINIFLPANTTSQIINEITTTRNMFDMCASAEPVRDSPCMMPLCDMIPMLSLDHNSCVYRKISKCY